MKPSIAKVVAITALAMAASDNYGFGPGSGQYTPWSQSPRGPRNKPGNSLTKGRVKAKARRKAQQKARRSA